MNKLRIHLLSAMVGALIASPATAATTPGTVRLQGTVSDYTGSTGASHFTVAWVTKADGTFIKTLWLQGPGFSSKEWNDHTPTYNNMRAGSTALDGFTGATVTSYTPPPASNNAVDVTWNCRDANGNMMEDGDYNFYIQYTESQTVDGKIIEGPITTPLTWTKGPAPATLTPSNQGTQGSPKDGNNFTKLAITWAPATVAPAITSMPLHSSGSMGTPYGHTVTATGSPQILFSVSSGSLPTGVTISPAGVVAGTPTVAGTFTGKIAADNGLTPATQDFSITIAQAIVFTNTPPTRGNRVTAYNHACSVIGTAPVTFTVDSGALPDGLTMNSQGVISGTPTTLGTFTGKIRASNGLAPDTLQDFTININPATEGIAAMTATISDYAGTTSTTFPAEHMAAAWVTDATGNFIKTLWKQGPAFSSKEWKDHITTYYNARGSNSVIDGFTSATAWDYTSAENNPLVVWWNGRDADGNLVDDGEYKFWIQYSENQRNVPGPVTTGGLTWTKGAKAFSVNPPAQGTQGTPANGNNFTNMAITWTLAPQIVIHDPHHMALGDGAVVDFGETEIHKAGAPGTFIIKNAGAVDLKLQGLSVFGAGATNFAVSPPVARTVAPGASTTFTMAFVPNVLGMSMATLEIASNDPDQSPVTLELMGTATPPPAPEIEVMKQMGSSLVSGKAKVSFGTVERLSSKTMTFTIKNTGTAPLTGLQVLMRSSQMNEFAARNLSAKVLQPGETATFDVTFTPKRIGRRSGALHIRSNDQDESMFLIQLMGAGAAPNRD